MSGTDSSVLSMNQDYQRNATYWEGYWLCKVHGPFAVHPILDLTLANCHSAERLVASFAF